MWSALTRLFVRKPAFKPGPPSAPQLLFTDSCVAALQECLLPEIQKRHEGIAYLAGRTDGGVTIAIAAMRPKAQTTPGSFNVTAAAMAPIVRAAASRGLQVVGQVHTHPREAFHSGGDEEGARIAYTGYVSLVLPDYGGHLPGFDGAAVYLFRAGLGFVQVEPARFRIIPGRLL
ncbi:MAG: hypothetical protein CMQ43_01565 [Gammaproteobacteria bacterium]|nr:hypothetical protein [Gammaproteobacteria bacterium]|tara:strand:+ start:3176 stop:3697 length:522 start_codon:yes stop_codon:yes gene_type:complete